MRKLQITLYILAAIPLLTGLIDWALGLMATKSLGAIIAEASYNDPLINSQFRFLSGAWIGFGALFIYAARDLIARKQLLRILLASVFIGGLGRAITVLQLGLPDNSVGTIFVITTLTIELLGMALLWKWHSVVLSKKHP